MTKEEQQQSQQIQKRAQTSSEAVAKLCEKIARRRNEAIIAALLRNEELRETGGFRRSQ